MLVQATIVIQQESGYIAKTPRGYIGILGETAAQETDTLTIALPDDYQGHDSLQEATEAFCKACNAAAEHKAYPYARNHEPE